MEPQNPEDVWSSTPPTELQYDDQQPDATVDTILQDETNPAMSEVTFSDGRKATMPTSHAQAMPQTPQPDLYASGQAFGPPAATPPADPNALQSVGVPAGTAPLDEAGLVGSVQAGPQAPPGAAGPNGGWGTPEFPLQNAQFGTLSGTPDVRPVDPNSAIVSPGSPGGEMLPSQLSETTNQYADSPEQQQARLGTAADAQAQAAYDTATQQHDAQVNSALTQAAGLEAQAAELEQQKRQAELEIAEHQRVVKAMEDHPLDEDAFWTSSPGREAGAWVALALSGFLQGATKGQNPALNQMIQSLNSAQDRHMQTLQRERDSVLARREKAMGHAENARDSVKMQLSGLVSKRIDLDAQRAGIPPVPALETYKAKMAMDVAERQNAIGQRIVSQATLQSRAAPATAPVRQAEVVLKNVLGPDWQKKHQDAMDPKGLNLGGQVQGADELTAVASALQKLQDPKTGQLAAQGVSLDKLGLAPFAARWGFQSGQDQVDARQLIERAKLAFKQTINIKSVDSENEGKNFNLIMDSGEGRSTVGAIVDKANAAKRGAISTADGVAPGASQQYIDYVRQTQNSNPYDAPKTGHDPERAARLRAASQVLSPGSGKPADERAVAETTGGGPAPSSPLAPPGARGPETSPTGSRPGTYRRLRESKPNEPR